MAGYETGNPATDDKKVKVIVGGWRRYGGHHTRKVTGKKLRRVAQCVESLQARNLDPNIYK
jgi:hypothetical protein